MDESENGPCLFVGKGEVMSTHTLITGVTMTGKTTLARMISREYDERGYPVFVYDPMGTATAGGDWGEKALIYNDEIRFMEFLSKRKNTNEAAVFIDESDLVFSHSQKHNHWLARRGRHYGYRLHMITQRPTMIAPNCRTQVGTCYMFRLARTDAKFCGNEFGHSDIDKYDLDTGDFLVMKSGTRKITRGNVFNLIKE